MSIAENKIVKLNYGHKKTADHAAVFLIYELDPRLREDDWS